MTDTPEIWVLCDDRAGNVGQSLGVAEALDLPFVRKDIAYTSFAKLPNFMLGASLSAVTSETKQAIKAPWPDLVISAGRRTAPVARYIKQKSGRKTKLVQVMHPGTSGALDFDLICVPAHDNKKLQPNEMAMIGAPHRVGPEKLSEARTHWEETFKPLGDNLIALIVGGATKDKEFNKEMAVALGQTVNKLAEEQGAGLLVTTSRRTGNIADDLMKEIKVPAHTFKWGDAGENPYFGYLACADHIIVTGDSVSMCSEACATEKPVYIYAPDMMISAKHSRMVQSLCDGGYAEIFAGKLSSGKRLRLNSAVDIAKKIKIMLHLD
ncbi:mitochondrial fission ELM1 family protein [Terasakiella sp. A23]|uniref:mitochondrial fission ELM1 family protein n=1 Tax=Terasakiella sp. FCG-A23 TaxID=3080561 RepID=UPI0029535B38|nr:mitochondrial fission ELM1 family protein [Terasakiella sp. A23]MDV7339279.1 mitochondrial fission ELM1 family protein [Terasakiella sp. A23]